MYRILVGANSKIVVLRNDDGSTLWIPMDEANADYQRYLAWVAEGNTAEPWQPESTTPTEP